MIKAFLDDLFELTDNLKQKKLTIKLFFNLKVKIVTPLNFKDYNIFVVVYIAKVTPVICAVLFRDVVHFHTIQPR